MRVAFCQAGNGLPLLKYEEYRKNNERKANQIVPAKLFFQIENRESAEDNQGDYFLDGFKLIGIEDAMADAVGGNLETILEKGNAPTYHNYHKQRSILVFQMPIPGKSHKDIGYA